MKQEVQVVTGGSALAVSTEANARIEELAKEGFHLASAQGSCAFGSGHGFQYMVTLVFSKA